MTRRSVAPAVLLLTLACCDRAPPATSAPSPGTPPPHAVPAAAPAAPDLPLPTFRDVAAEAGIDVVNHTGKPGDKDWIVSAMGGGAIALDYDSDGDIDLVVVDGTMLTSQGVLEYDDAWRTRLFRNDTAAGGSMKFTDVTAMSGIDLKAFGIGGASCDYDADGHPDFFVACWGPDHLFHNRGDGTFEDVTATAGVAGGERDMSTACAWGDVDGDGVHDLYVATHVDQQAFIDKTRASGKSPRLTKLKGFALAVGPLGIAPQADRLYLGQGDGTFRDATATNLVDQTPRHGFQPVMTDLDDDGDLDIFVANDLDLNHLWVNDGRGVFHDRASAAGAAMTKESKEQAGMGVDVEDVDRDGWLDIAVTAFSNEQNTIFLNRTGRARVLAFTDASESLGIAGPSFMRTSWGVRLLDYDNDGWLDHFAACGQLFGDIPGFDEATNVPYRQRCQLLRSGGPPAWMLTEVTDASGPAFGIARTWRGAAFGDFDDDGDTDVFVTALNDRAALFRNDCESGAAGRNRFLRFRLVGKGGLRDPSGARVSLHMPGGRVHLSELHHGASFCSDNDPRLLFGVGRLEVVPRVSVRWPGGTRQTFENVQTGSGFVIEEGNGRVLPDHCAPR